MEDQNSMEQTQTDIKTKIAEIRNRYAKLRMTCGLNRISKETIVEYTGALKALELQLN